MGPMILIGDTNTHLHLTIRISFGCKGRARLIQDIHVKSLSLVRFVGNGKEENVRSLKVWVSEGAAAFALQARLRGFASG